MSCWLAEGSVDEGDILASTNAINDNDFYIYEVNLG